MVKQGTARKEFQTRNAGVRRGLGHMGVQRRRAGADHASIVPTPRSSLPKAAGRRITTPGTPPSRTRRLEPTPITLIARRSPGRADEKRRQVFGISGTAEQNFGQDQAGAPKPDQIL